MFDCFLIFVLFLLMIIMYNCGKIVRIYEKKTLTLCAVDADEPRSRMAHCSRGVSSLLRQQGGRPSHQGCGGQRS
jgi:hypothetical protein